MLQHGNPDDGSGRPPAPLSSPPSTTTRAAGDPRRRILDAIVETVARRGYERTTVTRVLARAGVMEAVFAEHFENKHDCLAQAVEELLSGAEATARQRFGRPAPWAERVRDVLGELLVALAREPDRARVTFVEMLAAGPSFHERYRRALALFASLMEEGRACSPDATRLPAQTSEAVVGGIVSIVHRRVLEGQTQELPSLHGELTYFALLPYVGQERALDASVT